MDTPFHIKINTPTSRKSIISRHEFLMTFDIHYRDEYYKLLESENNYWINEFNRQEKYDLQKEEYYLNFEDDNIIL